MPARNLNKKSTFYCFSPPVMIAAFVIETCLLLYTIFRYKLNTLSRLSVLLLLFLALFQIAEFSICTGSDRAVLWSRTGFVAITLLPPLALHLIAKLRPKKRMKTSVYVAWAAYISAALFVGYFALSSGSITGHACLGNYIMFQVNPHMTWLYALYYYGWTSTGLWLSWQQAQIAPNKRIRQALYGFAWGFASFLIPTTTTNLVNSATRNGIPSIMCGFAVIFALILVIYVLPRIGSRRDFS